MTSDKENNLLLVQEKIRKESWMWCGCRLRLVGMTYKNVIWECRFGVRYCLLILFIKTSITRLEFCDETLKGLMNNFQCLFIHSMRAVLLLFTMYYCIIL